MVNDFEQRSRSCTCTSLKTSCPDQNVSLPHNPIRLQLHIKRFLGKGLAWTLNHVFVQMKVVLDHFFKI